MSKESRFKPKAQLPNFADLNLLDWSVNDHLYLWNASTGDIQQLLEMENTEEYVSSVAWIKEGNYLAVGTSNAEVQVCGWL